MHRIIRAMAAVAIALIAIPAAAQQTTVEELERKLDELLRQAAEIRQQLDALKGAPATTEHAEPGDLTHVDVIDDVHPLRNEAPPAPSRTFNPDISVIGNFLGHFGETNHFEGEEARAPFEFEEAELSFEAFIDPYARGRFFIGIGHHGAEVEEGYAQFLTLPYDLTAKAGKTKALFGKANTWHTHQRPWVDQPLVMQNFFGDHGLADSGISVSKLFPTDLAVVEGTLEVFSGEAEEVFERQSGNDLFYNSHLKVFRELNETNNLEVGASYARGTAGEAGASRFAGVDVTYRWKPLTTPYRGFVGRVEAIANDRDDLDDRRFGYYASGDVQLARRWFAGVRVDQVDSLVSEGTDRGLSGTVTFWPSEFSQLRGQVRRTRYGNLDTVTEFLLQLNFSIGAHGAHTF
jgi:hypothetical protein